MNCDVARVLVHGHLDGELDLAHDVEVQQHLAQCPRCVAEYSMFGAMHSRLKNDDALHFHAPAELKEKIRAAVYAAEPQTRGWSRWRSWFPSAIQFAVPLAIGAMLTLFVMPHPGGGAEDLIAREVVESHVRSMMPGHLMDVPSTDQHTVKPWFNGKLDFSPPVRDLAPDGFPLIGGRLDYIDNHPVAALIYQHGKHTINVFMWPQTTATTIEAKAQTQHGYNVEETSVSGMNCWIVSDLNQRELTKFAELLQTRT